MDKKDIEDFMNILLFNPAAGRKKQMFTKLTLGLFFVLIIMTAGFTFPLPVATKPRCVKLVIFFLMLFINGIFMILSNIYFKSKQILGFFKSSIFFSLQLICLIFVAYAGAFAFSESVNKLIFEILESIIIMFLIALLTAFHIRNKIKRGGYSKVTNGNQRIQPPKNFLYVGTIATYTTVAIAKLNTGVAVQALLLAFSMPVVFLTCHLMYLYYAKKYDLMEKLKNNSYIELLKEIGKK